MATDVLDPRIRRTRAVVLAATLEVVAENGFSGATIDAIAKRSDVARSTIYRNWPERTSLLLEAVSSEVGPLEPMLVGDLRADLTAVGTYLARLFASEPFGSVLVSMVLESRREPALDELRETFVSHRQAMASRVVQEAVSRGEFPSDRDAESIATDLAAGIFFRVVVLRQTVDEDWVAAHVDLLLAGYAGRMTMT